MKVLIRDKSLNLYLASGNQWVADAEQGWDFQVGIAAIDYARAQGFTDVDLWCVFRNPTHNFCIPFEALKRFRASKVIADSAPGRTKKTEPVSAEAKRQMRFTRLWFKLEELEGVMQSNEDSFQAAKRKLGRPGSE